MAKKKLYIVAVADDNGGVDHIRCYESKTWTRKYGRAAGDAARYAEVEVEFSNALPASAEVEVTEAKSE